MRTYQFTKMQGLGNDFIVFEGPMDLPVDDIPRLCDRRFGIGADGVLVISRGDSIRMEYWNADGSEAEMCGNGLRCLARYAYERGWAADRNFAIQTPVGMRGVRVLEDRIEAEMGRARIDSVESIEGRDYHLVDIGNPHAVTYVDDPGSIDVTGIGQKLQGSFPDGVNVEFIAPESGNGFEMRVYERGVGETLACGTGMAAAAAVFAGNDETPGTVSVRVPGGQAQVDFRDGVAWLIGPADYSFTGSVGGR